MYDYNVDSVRRCIRDGFINQVIWSVAVPIDQPYVCSSNIDTNVLRIYHTLSHFLYIRRIGTKISLMMQFHALLKDGSQRTM